MPKTWRHSYQRADRPETGSNIVSHHYAHRHAAHPHLRPPLLGPLQSPHQIPPPRTTPADPASPVSPRPAATPPPPDTPFPPPAPPVAAPATSHTTSAACAEKSPPPSAPVVARHGARSFKRRTPRHAHPPNAPFVQIQTLRHPSRIHRRFKSLIRAGRRLPHAQPTLHRQRPSHYLQPTRHAPPPSATPSHTSPSTMLKIKNAHRQVNQNSIRSEFAKTKKGLRPPGRSPL